MGRPTKLTADRQNRLLDAIRIGSYIAPACGYAGIGESTYYQWLERGQLARLTHDQNLDNTHTDHQPTGTHPTGPPPCPPCDIEWPFVEFAEAVSRAQHEAEVAALGSIREAAGRHVKRERTHQDGSVTREFELDWRAAAWLLERRFPERWRKITSDDPDDAALEERVLAKFSEVLGDDDG